MNNPNEVISINQFRIGKHERTLLIAEISANHDKDLDQAIELVDLTANSGWDCVKFQTYSADSLTVKSKHSSLIIDPVWGKSNLYDLYNSAAMPVEFHQPLFDRAREKSLLPFTTVYDPRDLDFVEALGCELYKIASFELTYDDLLAQIGATRKPVILSTGMANLKEIERALEILEHNGTKTIILLHCCSAYPAPIDSVNLRSIETISNKFNRLVGFSDHTVGADVPIIASAMGAVVIEKHITNDVTRTGPDHRFSCSPQIMRKISAGVRKIQLARGSGIKDTQLVESNNKLLGRRSAFALRRLPAHHRIEEGDFRFVRPCSGIPANRKNELIGKRLVRSVDAFHPITFEDIGK